MNTIPQEIDICLSNQCNLRCRYCYSGNLDRSRVLRLTLPRIKAGVLAYLRAAGRRAEKISLSGGEPLLDKPLLAGLLPWLRRAAGPRLEIECFSNGLLLDRKTAELFRDSRVHLKISLDGAPASQDLNRVDAGGGGSAARVVRNIRALPPGLRRSLGLSSTVTRATAPRLSENLKFLASLGAGDLGLSFAVQERWSRSDLAALRRELKAAAAFLKGPGKKAFRDAPRFSYKLMKPGKAWLESFCGQGEVSLGPDGNFYPCSMLSASRAAQEPALRARYAAGDWRTGPDFGKVRASRERVFRAVTAAGEKDFLGCLLCIYYSAVLHGGSLRDRIRSSADIVRQLRATGMGAGNPDVPGAA